MFVARLTLPLLIAALPALASAQSEAEVYLLNETSPNFFHSVVDGSESVLSGQLDFSYTRDFTGRDINSDPGTFTFTANATAIGGAGSLKSTVSATLTKPQGFYSTGGNTPYVIGTGVTELVDPNGLPRMFEAGVHVTFVDTLTVAGGAGLASIRLNLGVTGEIDAANPNGTARFNLYQNFSNSLVSYYQNGSYDEHFLSNAIAITGGAAQVQLSTWSYIDYDLNDFAFFDANTYSTTLDFFSTAKIESVSGYDSQGNQVDLYSAVGADGTIYTANLATVPEPATYGLIAGAIALGCAALRRRNAEAALASA